MTDSKSDSINTLFELMKKSTLEHLLVGFSDKLKMGVKIGVRDEQGNIVLIREDPDLAERVWSKVCYKFRSCDEGNNKCEMFDIKIVDEYLTPPYPSARYHECDPLGLIDMAVPIRVQGKNLGVVIAGQRILRSEVNQVKTRMIAKNPKRKEDLLEAFNQEINKKHCNCICDEDEIEKLLKGLKDFAKMIGEICEKIAVLNYEKLHKTKRLEILHEISNKMLSFENLNSLIDYVVKITKEFLCAETSAIFLFKEDRLKRIKINGIKTPDWFQDEFYRIGEGATGRVVTSKSPSKFGKPILDNSFETSKYKILEYTKKYEQELQTGKLKHLLAVPLNGENRSYGVLRAINKLDSNGSLSQKGFSSGDLHLLLTIASQVAVAIANIRSKEKLRSIFELSEYIAGQVSERQICRKIVSILTSDVWNFKVSFLQIYNEKSGELVNRAAAGAFFRLSGKEYSAIKRGKGISGIVFDNGECIASENIQNDKRFFFPGWAKKNNLFGMLCVPLKTETKVIGTLSVFTGNEYHFYPDEIRSLEIFANHGTLVLKNSQFVNKLQRVTETYPSISKLSTSIEDVLKNVAEIAKDVLDADIVVIYRYDSKRKTIIFPPVVAGKLFKPRYMEKEVSNTAVPYIFIQKGKNHFSDLSLNDNIFNTGLMHIDGNQDPFIVREKVISSGGVLLKVSEEVVGVIFFNYRSLHKFDENEKKIIELYASYIAIAIQNVLHFLEKETADALKLVGEVSQRLAHIMKTDIGTIRLYIDSILRKCNEDDPVRFPLNESRIRLSEMADKINNFLKLSTIKYQRKVKTNIVELFNEFQSHILPTLKKRHLDLVSEIKVSKPMLNIDPEQINIVFSNMADNSISFMKKGGVIKITIYKKKNTLFIEWSDSGSGIPCEIVKQIFDIGFTTRADGFGLGLFHTKTIIEDYGGSITLDQEYRCGAKFIIRLPMLSERKK